jgi:hypothetical protein
MGRKEAFLVWGRGWVPVPVTIAIHAMNDLTIFETNSLYGFFCRRDVE